MIRPNMISGTQRRAMPPICCRRPPMSIHRPHRHLCGRPVDPGLDWLEMRELAVPDFYRPDRVGEVWRVPYEERARDARAWAEQHAIRPAAEDSLRVCLLAVDVQNTFCIPGFELFVGGRSGTGAVDDSRRLCEFVYRNLGSITQVFPSLDTHRAMQVFHAIWLVDAEGRHPDPYTLVSVEDVETGRWRFNAA